MTDRLDEAGMPMLAQPCAALTTANAEREALEAIHEFLGIASKRLYPTPDKPNSDWAKLRSAVDALALLEARAALTAGKVAEQEPTGFKTVPVKVTDAMIDAANAVPSGLAGSPPHWQWVWDALLSAAPQQTAQEPVAWLHTTTNNSEREAFEAAMIRLSNMEESAHDKPYPGDDEANAFWAFWKEARAALTAGKVTAEPVAQEDHECEYQNGDGVCRQCAELAKRAKPFGYARAIDYRIVGQQPEDHELCNADAPGAFPLYADPQQTAQSTEPKTAREAVIEECVKECYVVLNAARCARSRHAAALCVVAVCALLTPPRKTTC
jgi:hypothetical protein